MAQYTVQPGDTLGKIAAETLGSASRYMEIAEANHMDNPNALRVGQVLEIPGDAAPEVVAPVVEPVAPATPTQTTSGGGVTAEHLTQIMPKASGANIEKYTGALNDEMAKAEINTPMRMAHFIAQLAHESGSFHYSQENLNYSAKALRAVFGKYFPDDETALAYERKPEKIANRVYASRMGNGDEASGDGWKFRGRGLIQLTGTENYTNCAKGIGKDLLANPDQLSTDANAAVAASAWFWNMRKLNDYADQDDIKQITKRINGGYNGLEDRQEFLERAKAALEI